MPSLIRAHKTMTGISNEITELLLRWSGGDKEALDELLPMVYPELRRLARSYMRREAAEHTLQTSALINEAYLRLVNQNGIAWQDRAHFLAVAAQVMRRILIDHARSYQYYKRGAGAAHVTLNDATVIGDQRAREFLALDDALNALAALDERKTKIVEMRFFGGLTVEEIAEVLKVSPITVKREWRLAKAFLHLEMSA